MALLVILLLIIFVLAASRSHPIFTFWLLINLYFDPGGYQLVWFQGNIISIINFTDIIFLLCWIPYLSTGPKKSFFQEDKYFKVFYKLMSLFLFYFVIIYGYIIPQINGRNDFLTFIIKSRLYFMAFLLIKPLYYFVKKGLAINFKLIIYIATICLTLYFVSLLTNINLIPIARGDRYVNSGIIRITMWNYGLFDWVLNLAIIILILKIRIQNKKLLLYSGLLMATSIILTLTRRELVGRVYSVFLLLILIYYIFKNQRKIRIQRIIIPVTLLFGLIFITFPQYIQYANNEYKSLGTLISKGTDREGNVDYRLAGTGDVIAMKKLIKENIFFGIGFTRYSYDDLTSFRDLDNPLAGLYAGGELPYLGSLGKMGIIGLIFFLPIYILILSLTFKLIRVLRKINLNKVIRENLYDLIFVLFSITFIINKFTFNLFNLFVESYNPSALLSFIIILNILLVCYHNLNKTYKNQQEAIMVERSTNNPLTPILKDVLEHE